MPEVKLTETINIPLKHSKILRGPLQVAFDLTNKCNFRCLHCFNLSGENMVSKNELKDNDVIKFIKEIADLKVLNLCFCGGEPLLREKILCESAKILSAQGVIVSLVTNGSLITLEKASKLNESGVSRVQVSLDGSRSETHERLRMFKNSFNLTVNAISYLREVGYEEITVAFTPTSFNCSEFKETFNLCRNLGVSIIRVQPLMILGRTQINREELLPTPLQYRKLIATINEIRENCTAPFIEWGDPVDHLIRFRTILENCCPYVNIRANGDIVPSPYLPLVVGNIKKHTIKEYWDAGLPRIWKLPLVKELAERVRCISDFGKNEGNAPTVWFEEDIRMDIIDDKLYKILS